MKCFAVGGARGVLSRTLRSVGVSVRVVVEVGPLSHCVISSETWTVFVDARLLGYGREQRAKKYETGRQSKGQGS